MKSGRSIIWLTLGLVVVIALVIWFTKRPAQISDVSNPTVPASSSQINASSNSVPAPKKPNPVVALKQRLGGDFRMQQELSTQNDVPIIFYGKVVDQFGNAVSDATVNFGVRVYNGFEETVKKGQVKSDANGLFEISGYKGERLGIGVVKPGYAWVSMNGSGIYSKLWPENERAHPDPTNPTIIKMWKLQGAEPLLSINKTFKLPYSAAPIHFDFIKGQVVPSDGDLVLTISRASGQISAHNKLDWGVKVEAVNGGVMDSSSQGNVIYEAPATGYESSLSVTFSTNAPMKWAEGFNKEILITSRNNQLYSKISVMVSINYNPNGPLTIRINGVANTNGSRNWEATVPQ